MPHSVPRVPKRAEAPRLPCLQAFPSYQLCNLLLLHGPCAHVVKARPSSACKTCRIVQCLWHTETGERIADIDAQACLAKHRSRPSTLDTTVLPTLEALVQPNCQRCKLQVTRTYVTLSDHEWSTGRHQETRTSCTVAGSCLSVITLHSVAQSRSMEVKFSESWFSR